MGVKIIWSDKSWADFEYWLDHDKKTAKRIRKLIKNTVRTPFEGIGKTEALKGDMAGLWSKRIDETNRFVYFVKPDGLYIVSVRFNYYA